MQSITLSPELASILTVEAERSGKTLSALVKDWLRQQYQTLRREQLATQTKQFWANQASLYAQYPDQYVAFYNEQVLDHDEDLRQLALRVRARYGDLPMVIAQVTSVPVKGYQMRSPRLSQVPQ